MGRSGNPARRGAVKKAKGPQPPPTHLAIDALDRRRQKQVKNQRDIITRLKEENLRLKGEVHGARLVTWVLVQKIVNGDGELKLSADDLKYAEVGFMEAIEADGGGLVIRVKKGSSSDQ